MAENYIPRSSLDNNKNEGLNERKKMESVVQTPAKPKKESTWQKIKKEFTSDDTKSVSDYLIFDVLIPAVKKTIQDMIDNGVEMILWGGTSRAPRQSNIPGSRVSYRNYYDQRNPVYTNKPRIGSYEYEEGIFNSRTDAEIVLYRMQEALDRYSVVRVADYLELSGRNSSFTDNNYGWTNLDNVQIRRSRDGGYYLELPRPMALD